MKGDEIALAVHREPGSGHVKGTLSSMVKRGILENRRGFGYFERQVSARS